MKRLKEFLSAEQCVGKTVSKIVFSPNTRGNVEYGPLGCGSVAIHFGPEQVAVFAFGDDYSGCYYAGDSPESFGVNIEDEHELSDYEASADTLELWRGNP